MNRQMRHIPLNRKLKMKTLAKLLLITLTLLLAAPGVSQADDNDELKLAAIEALITAPDDKALPLVIKVLGGNHSDEVKEAALFILSQINAPEAHAILLKFASVESGELQYEAIRMIGIGGGDGVSDLKSIYESGDSEAREAVLEALMIAGDKQAVFEIAEQAEGRDFEDAVEMLAVMGARDELRLLRSTKGTSEALIEACAISGDFECLSELAADGSDTHLQIEAIESMGIVGGDRVDAALVEIYKGSSDEDIREAAMDGLMISGNDTGLLELYRSSEDSSEKKELLEYLVMMGSDEVWAIIDSALDGGE
jgi:HEAT repeat protein